MALTLEELAVLFTVQGDNNVINAFINIQNVSNQTRDTLVSTLNDTGNAFGALGTRMNSVAVSGAFAMESLAEGGERGVLRLARSIGMLGLSFDPMIGALVVGAALLGEKLVEVFHHTSSAISDMVKNAADQAQMMRFNMDFAGITKNQETLQANINDLRNNIIPASIKAWNDAKLALQTLSDQGYGKQSHAVREARNAEIEAYDQLKAKQDLLQKLIIAQNEYNKAATAPVEPVHKGPGLPLGMTIDPNAGVKAAEEARRKLEEQMKKDAAFVQQWQDEQMRNILEGLSKMETAAKTEGKKFTEAVAGAHEALVKSTAEMWGDALKNLEKDAKKANEVLKTELTDPFQKDLQKWKDVIGPIGEELGTALTDGFQAAFSGKGVAGAMASFGDAILRTLGDIFKRMGEALIDFGTIINAVATWLKANVLLSGPAAIAAGIALMALGAALSSAATSGGGGRGGGSSGYVYGATSTTGTIAVSGGVPASGGMGANTGGVQPLHPVAVGVTVIGKDDPSAQRQILQLIQRAQLRGTGAS